MARLTEPIGSAYKARRRVQGRQFSSVVEQLFCKQQVVGSIPTTGSSFPFGSDLFQRGESSTALPKGWQGN